MQSLEANCPRCDSEQKFPRRKEHFRDAVFRVYIKCTMCRWERTIEYVTHRLLRLREERAKLIRLAGAEQKRYRTATLGTRRQQKRNAHKIAQEQALINRKVTRWTAHSQTGS